MTYDEPLPPPLTDSWDWLAAACREMDPNTFFLHPASAAGAENGGSNGPRTSCTTCPVIQQP
jgi:hypothetical protein